ncbi:MAG: glycosyltransferase family 2 protein [Crocinitomicaceae bacterium]|nr:glycosyltransferase family 2 protein [Crocinitomicaceae bacterium]
MSSTPRITCKKVAIALLGYNSKDYLERFIPGILQTKYQDRTVVYIDNGSTDDSIKYVEENFPEVEIFKIEINAGFTGGYNQSLANIDAEYYVLLNSDVEVTPEWLDTIIDYMDQHKNIGAAQPKILHQPEPDHFDYAGASGGYIDKYGYPFCRGRIFNTLEKDEHQYDSCEKIFWASGACMILKADLYHELGGLDNNFFTHMEEIDLSWRISNAGYDIVVYPKSVVYHVGGSIIKYGSFTKLYHNYRNNLVMLYKNLPKRRIFPTIFMRIGLDIVAATRALFTLRFTEVRAIMTAHLHFFFKRKLWKQSRLNALKHVKTEAKNGIYRRSIVWDYFILGKKKFSRLKF